MLKTFSSLFLLTFLFALSQAHSDSKPNQRIRFEFQKDDFVYHLLSKPPTKVGDGGKIYGAYEEQWRTLSQQRETESTSLAVALLEPCGLISLHYHPRASEIAYVAKGNNILVGFVEEDGGRLVLNKMKKGDATLFETGLIQFIANQGCDDAEIISGYSNKDPGYVQVALNSFKFPANIIAGSFGMTEEYVERIKKSGIPFTPVQSEECLRRCKNNKYDDGKSMEKEHTYY